MKGPSKEEIATAKKKAKTAALAIAEEAGGCLFTGIFVGIGILISFKIFG